MQLYEYGQEFDNLTKEEEKQFEEQQQEKDKIESEK